jgi:hypothetical protein
MLHNVAETSSKRSSSHEKEYNCKKCDYITYKLGNWERHIKTKKHNVAYMLHNSSKRSQTKSLPNKQSWNCDCGKEYKYHQSYYRHKKLCDKTEKNTQLSKSDTVVESLLDIIKNQQKQIITVSKSKCELLQSFKDIIPHIGNNNTTNSNNTNINVFLDKHCSKAVSIQDFAAQLSLSLNDIGMLRNDEPKAIANVIRNSLIGMGATDRPMHTHKQRWYVKDKNNGWEGDSDGKIVSTIKVGITRGGLSLLSESTPDWKTNDKQGALYAETTSVLMRDIDNKNAARVLRSIENDCVVTDI